MMTSHGDLGTLSPWLNGCYEDSDRVKTVPPLNAWENADGLTIEAEVPGLKMEDLELTVHDDVLTLRGKRKNDHAEGAAVLRHECEAGAFERSLRLPYPTEEAHVSATLKNGILTITLPKAEALKPRKIEVKVGNG